MNELDGIGIIDAAFSRFGYPEELLSSYDQLECLSAGRDRETFLMKSKADGSLAVAKCYDRSVYVLPKGASEAADDLDCPGIPKFLGRYESDSRVCILREYAHGTPLNEYVKDKELSRDEIVGICAQLCDILTYLHGLSEPVIHRDIKPQNVVVSDDGKIWLIDLDIARVFKPDSETDTVFFGTRGYAPPEQYGFSQTDARTDIYSLGVLLRYLLTGSIRRNTNVRLYRPLQKVIDKCTAFAPEKRYADAAAVKRALLAADPCSQFLRKGLAVLCAAAVCALLVFAGVKVYRAVTYTPFTADHIPEFMSDEERVRDAMAYMKAKYGTDMFEEYDDVADVGLLRRAMIELYGLDKGYVYGINNGIPCESEEFFMPWGWGDEQTVPRDVAIYAAVKAHDPSIVADWSSIKDDNGFYPGVRVAAEFAEQTGIASGVNRPEDIWKGELALILANAERVFGPAER